MSKQNRRRLEPQNLRRTLNLILNAVDTTLPRMAPDLRAILKLAKTDDALKAIAKRAGVGSDNEDDDQ